MPHELNRIIAAMASRPWAIEDRRAEELLTALALRHAGHPATVAFDEELDPPEPAPLADGQGAVAVINLMGTVAPRVSGVNAMSGSFVSLERWGAAFRAASEDRGVRAILINVDSPGGMVDLVPETAAMVRAARRPGRPIWAIANTRAASAAYWIASQADRLLATPSGLVGSIGVRTMHVDQSAALKAGGLAVTEISAGARKTEGSPFRPLDAVAKRAVQAEIDETYADFAAAVAAARGVSESVVRADPEKAAEHMGGGRALSARQALRLGMIDGIATLGEALSELRRGSPAGAAAGGRRADAARRRFALR